MTYEIFVDADADFIEDDDGSLKHYGILRRSGRYPWGSGGPEENTGPDSFLGYVEELRKNGFSEVEIAKGMDTSTTQLRAAKSIAKNAQKQARIIEARRLKDKGMADTAIAEQMFGRKSAESTVRSLLSEATQARADVLDNVVGFLRDQVHQKGFVDVGGGTEHHIPIPGISDQRRKNAIARLREEGYTLHHFKVKQLATGKETSVQALAAPGTPYSPKNIDKVKQITAYSDDGGRTILGIQPPLSISSKRLAINYKEDGGDKADGVIFVRPGVKDVSIGENRYAQVRIMIDNTHFVKGMAMYKDDLPKGTDLVFNTNKKNTGNKLDALKPLKESADNPFGSTVRQIPEHDEHGHAIPNSVSSAMNIVGSPTKEGSGVEGSWDSWSKTLSSQFLSKQEPKFARDQLRLARVDKKADLDEIMKLTNPAVKKKLLEEFADSADSAAVHLKAAQMPRQANRVILPMNSLKPTEIYAPGFRNGERVVLIRHPHGGTFEIPELTVNNKHPEGVRLLGDAADCIGIHHTTADKLSGADFDGDTVLVIPNNHGKVQHTSSLEGLKNFDPKTDYAPHDGMRTINGGHWDASKKEAVFAPGQKPNSAMQNAMGNISNLITDMTIGLAHPSEIARAVRHSMVIIDAEKHSLNYKQSELDNGIAALKKKYQGKGVNPRAGAATLISRKKQKMPVPERKQGYSIDPVTGQKIYRPTGTSYVDKKTGKTVERTEDVYKLNEIPDARALSSGTLIERIYADHSNAMSALANQARIAMVRTPSVAKNSSAAKHFASEVSSLDTKLVIAERNRPLERQAQILGNTWLRAVKAANPGLDREEEKKVRFQALAEARTRMGAKKTLVEITDDEWKAIQAGAISNDKLNRILKNANMDIVKKFATPKQTLLMTTTNVARAKAMAANGFTQQEIADQLGVSLTTLKTSLK